MLDQCANYSRTYKVLLPMLGMKISRMPCISNCYLGDKNRPEITGKIFVLVDKSKDIKFTELYIKGYGEPVESILEKEPLFMVSYPVDEVRTMYVFNVPVEYERDYQLFLNGKYSEMSGMYKRHWESTFGTKTWDTWKGIDYRVIFYPTHDYRSTLAERLGVTINDIKEVYSIPQNELYD